MEQRQSVQTENISCGILLLNKPAGLTSHDCVNKVRKLYSTRQVGHTGTLDPMATGVLPVLIGRAVKASEYISSESKRYSAVLQLGLTTDTEDITGTVLSTSEEIPDAAEVTDAALSFTGDIFQTPPMYSALKLNGKKLVDLARAGQIIDRPARPVSIYSIECIPIDTYRFCLEVYCSKGVYIRTLCADIGAKLGCGGVMATLHRRSSGNFSEKDCVTLEYLENADANLRNRLLLPLEAAFSSLRKLYLPAFYRRLAGSGQQIYLRKLRGETGEEQLFSEGEYVRLYGADGFFALAQIRAFASDDGSYELAAKPVKQFVI